MGLRFTHSEDDADHPFQLDLVGLLAIVGESAMRFHIQALTASAACLLPRLIPAPHAALHIRRPRSLPAQVSTSVVGILSGNVQDNLNFFASLLTPVEDLTRYTVRRINVARNPDHTPTTASLYPLLGRWKRSASSRPYPPPIGARLLGPLPIVSVLSMLASIGLLIWAVLLEDGPAMVAVILLSGAATIVGFGSVWTVDLPQRKAQRDVPAGDVIIRSRHGAFLIVHCDETIARDLYFGKEECNYYVGENTFKSLSGIATFLFMVAIIFVANCTWTMQAALGLAYILLNGVYWVIALLPEQCHWDLGGYRVDLLDDTAHATFTDALWTTIHRTQSTSWARPSSVVPHTPAWDAWLAEAHANVHRPDWPAGVRLTELLKKHATLANPSPSSRSTTTDVFPLTKMEIQSV